MTDGLYPETILKTQGLIREAVQYQVDIVRDLCEQEWGSWSEIKNESYIRAAQKYEWINDMREKGLNFGAAYSESPWGRVAQKFSANLGARLGVLKRELFPDGNGSEGDEPASPTRSHSDRLGAVDFMVMWFHEMGRDVLPATWEALGIAAGFTPDAYRHGKYRLEEMGYKLEKYGGDGVDTRSFWRVAERPTVLSPDEVGGLVADRLREMSNEERASIHALLEKLFGEARHD